jgi:hypothetical protein
MVLRRKNSASKLQGEPDLPHPRGQPVGPCPPESRRGATNVRWVHPARLSSLTSSLGAWVTQPSPADGLDL